MTNRKTFGKLVADLKCAALHWNSDNASNTGASLAFFCAFSLAPLLVILLTIAGWVVGAQAAYSQIGAQLNSLFGPATAKILLAAMKSSQAGQGLVAAVVSTVTLLIGATSVLAALDQTLELIWQSATLAPTGIKGWLRTRFLSLGFILALGFLLLVSLTVTTVLSGLRDRVAHEHTALVGALGFADLLISLVMVTVLFASIFRYLPARRIPWLAALGGGVLTALLFDLGRWGIGIYLSHSTQPSAYGAASSFAALLLWLYYTALIFLFGAEFTACLGGLREPVIDRTPEESASSSAIERGKVSVSNALAGVAVHDLATAAEWYSKVIGAAGTHPMEEVYEWSLQAGGVLQVFRDPPRAGRSSVTLSVIGLEQQLARLEGLGIRPASRTSGAEVSTAIVRDPDENQVVLAEQHSAKVAR